MIVLTQRLFESSELPAGAPRHPGGRRATGPSKSSLGPARSGVERGESRRYRPSESEFTARAEVASGRALTVRGGTSRALGGHRVTWAGVPVRVSPAGAAAPRACQRAGTFRRPMSIRTDLSLRDVAAIRYVTPLREGGSLPGLVEADDDGLYVVKFRGAGQGLRALVAEVIVGELARRLGLLVPDLVTVEIDPVLGAAEPDPEIQQLITASAGANLGVDFLPGALPYTPARSVRARRAARRRRRVARRAHDERRPDARATPTC